MYIIQKNVCQAYLEIHLLSQIRYCQTLIVCPSHSQCCYNNYDSFFTYRRTWNSIPYNGM